MRRWTRRRSSRSAATRSSCVTRACRRTSWRRSCRRRVAPGVADAHVAALTELADDADFRALVEAIVRITRIVPADTTPGFDAALLTEPAEAALAQAVEATPQSSDLRALASGHAGLVAPIATFFDDILVMADDPALKAARLGLLATILAKAPMDLDWRAVDAATS